MCVAGVRKGKGRGKAPGRAREAKGLRERFAHAPVLPLPFPFLAPATQAVCRPRILIGRKESRVSYDFFCLREPILGNVTDCFFFKGIKFFDFQKVTFKWNSIFVSYLTP